MWLNAALDDPTDPFFQFHDGNSGRCEIGALRALVVAHEEGHHDFFLSRLRAAAIDPYLDGLFLFKRHEVLIEDLNIAQDLIHALWIPPDIQQEEDALPTGLTCDVIFDIPSPAATEVN